MPNVPTWKDHFPIAWVDDHFVTRREFTKSLVWVSVATFVANGIVALLGQLKQHTQAHAFPRLAVAQREELPIGGAKVFYYPTEHDPCLLVRLESDHYVAFGQQCTHLGCPVYYRATERRLHCPCHEGWFHAEDGRVLAGPPSRPLPRIALDIQGDQVWAIGQL